MQLPGVMADLLGMLQYRAGACWSRCWSRTCWGSGATGKLSFGSGQTSLKIGNGLLCSDVWSSDRYPLLDNAGDLLSSTFASITPSRTSIALGAAKGLGGPVNVNVPLLKLPVQVREEDTSR